MCQLNENMSGIFLIYVTSNICYKCETFLKIYSILLVYQNFNVTIHYFYNHNLGSESIDIYIFGIFFQSCDSNACAILTENRQDLIPSVITHDSSLVSYFILFYKFNVIYQFFK